MQVKQLAIEFWQVVHAPVQIQVVPSKVVPLGQLVHPLTSQEAQVEEHMTQVVPLRKVFGPQLLQLKGEGVQAKQFVSRLKHETALLVGP